MCRIHPVTPAAWTITARLSSWWTMEVLAAVAERQAFVQVWRTTFPISALAFGVRKIHFKHENCNA